MSQYFSKDSRLLSMVYMKSMLMWLVLSLFFKESCSFIPNHYGRIISGNDFTHADITEIGILKAVAEYFENNPPPGISSFVPGTLTGIPDITARKLYDKVYGGSISERRFQHAIDEIIKHNNKVDQDHYTEASWHCNGEQIRDGNLKMQSLRESALQMLNSTSPNYGAVREIIGQYLHILQMFYSNTNWVELYGETIYHNLSITGKPIMPTSEHIPITCKPCGLNEDGTCSENLQSLGHILTSGYKGEHNTDDIQENTNGKCSHGGLRDTSGISDGINKDTSNPVHSPHFTLHRIAALSAIQHTKYFFSDPIYGIRSIVGDEKFKDLLQLNPSSSLVFVIDSASLVGEEVQPDVQNINDIVMETAGTTNQPDSYVLVVNDNTHNSTSVNRTKDAKQFITRLKSLRLHPSVNCPEFSLNGIKTAAAEASPYSRIYVFTNSSPKDTDKMDYILSLVTEKKIQVQFITSDPCKQMEIQDEEQPETDDREMEEESSERKRRSMVYSETDKKDLLPNAAYIIRREVDSSDISPIEIPVDVSVSKLEIRIQGQDALPRLYVQNPQGDYINRNGTGIKEDKQAWNTLIYEIKKPEPGVWNIYKIDKESWNLDVLAETQFDFGFKFFESDTDGSTRHEISWRQLTGRNVVTSIKIDNAKDIKTIERLVIYDNSGNEIAQTSLNRITEDKDTYESSIAIPQQDFSVAIDGRDKHGNRFLRMHRIKHIEKRQLGLGKRSTPIVYQGINIYKQIAQLSGGHVFPTTKTLIGGAVGIIQGSSTSTDVLILRQTVVYGEWRCNEFFFSVDNTITEFKMTIKSDPVRMPFISIGTKFMRPPGMEPNTTYSVIGNAVAVATFMYPKIDTWKFRNIAVQDWDVEITAKSSLDFTYKFLETGPGGSLYEITGRPITGRNTSLVVRINDMSKLSSLKEVFLNDIHGQRITSSPLTPKQGSHAVGLYTASVIMPDEDFQVGILGKDTQVRPATIQRLHKILVSSTKLNLDILTINDPFYVKERLIVPFRLTNLYSGYTTVDVDIVDDKGFALSPTNKTFNIPEGDNITSNFLLQGNTSGITTTVTISARPRGATGSKFQYVILRLTTVDRTTQKVDTFSPVCTIIQTAGKCSSDLCKCNETRLITEAEVWDYGSGLNIVAASGAGNNAKFTYDQFYVGDIKNISGVVKVKLDMDCCRKEAYITVSDVDGNQGKCLIQANNVYEKDGCKEQNDAPSDSGGVNTAVIAGVGAGAGAIVIATIVTSVVIVKKKLASSATSVTPANLD